MPIRYGEKVSYLCRNNGTEAEEEQGGDRCREGGS